MGTDHIEGGGRWGSRGRGRRGRNRHLDPVGSVLGGLETGELTLWAGGKRRLLQNRRVEVSSQERALL